MNQSSTHPVAATCPVLPARRPLTEAELIRLLRQREEKAFSRLYERYAPAFYAIALRIVRNQPLAQDVVVESFVKIWQQFPQYDETKGRLFTWMLNVMRNQAIDQRRSRCYREGLLTGPLNPQVACACAGATYQPELLGLRVLFRHLRPEEEKLVELVYFQGYSGPQTAQLLGIPLGTVKTRLRTAVQKLRQCLNRENPAATPSPHFPWPITSRLGYLSKKQ